jgi:hypothetical protein
MKPDCPNCQLKNCHHILDYSDKVVITITKVKSFGEPSHWEYDLDTGAGGTSPTFYGAIDMAIQSITGDYGDFDSIHNSWVDFDANEREK